MMTWRIEREDMRVFKILYVDEADGSDEMCDIE